MLISAYGLPKLKCAQITVQGRVLHSSQIDQLYVQTTLLQQATYILILSEQTFVI